MKRPNILYIHSHDTGRYIQPYGYSVPTPTFQKLAEDGVLFHQAFCAGPTCSPSRAALLTGQCPHSAGMLGLAHRGWSLKDYKQHIIHTLRHIGYRSTLIGMQHIVAEDQIKRIGYDQVVPHGGWKIEKIIQGATDVFRQKHDKPFFLSVGFSRTHRPFPTDVPEEESRYIRPPTPIPDTPQTRRDMAAFIRSVRIYDNAVGRVLDALERNGIAENTIVISTTDHGIAFPAMKCNLTDHGIGIMLMMRGPGGFFGGKVIDGMVSHIDVFPTLCEYLGIEKPAWLEGKSMMPLVRGEAEEINEEIFSEVTYHAAYEPKRAVRTKRWKYIRRFEERNRPVLCNCDASPSKDLWLEHDWKTRAVAKEQLYDLVYDPNETHNLSDDPDYSERKKEMRGRLQAWMEQTDDPLLKGAVPLPDGAWATPQDAIHP